MRYEPATALSREDTTELVVRIRGLLESRGVDLSGITLGLYREVEPALVLLRQNISQMVAAEMFDVSQPTLSRTYRRMIPLAGARPVLHRHRAPNRPSRSPTCRWSTPPPHPRTTGPPAGSRRPTTRASTTASACRSWSRPPAGAGSSRPRLPHPARATTRGSSSSSAARTSWTTSTSPGWPMPPSSPQPRVRHQEDTRARAPGLGTRTQQDSRQHTRRGRALYCSPEELEDHRHRLPRPT